MGHTYSQILLHIVFSTKHRQPMIDNELRDRLFEYMGGIVNNNIGAAIVFGGVADHVHGLIKVKPSVAVSEAMRELKAGSSGWIHDEFPSKADFAWQSGYSAFSVSQSNVEPVRRYILNQQEHHRKRTFQEELVALLDRHGVEYDPKYVFD